MTNRQEAEQKVAKLKTLYFLIRVTGMDNRMIGMDEGQCMLVD